MLRTAPGTSIPRERLCWGHKGGRGELRSDAGDIGISGSCWSRLVVGISIEEESKLEGESEVFGVIHCERGERFDMWNLSQKTLHKVVRYRTQQ